MYKKIKLYIHNQGKWGKAIPIPIPSPFQGGENPQGAGQGRVGQAGQGIFAIPQMEISNGELSSIVVMEPTVYLYLCNIV